MRGQASLRSLGAIALLLGLIGMAGCARVARGTTPAITPPTVTPGDVYANLLSGGMSRAYHVHLPPAVTSAKPLPLLLALHGRLGDGAGQERLTGFDALADQYGFIVIYPDGYQRSWADGRGTTPADKAGVDDVAFLSAVLSAVEARYPVDAHRVYVAGMSNGGFMTERLGCDLSRRLAAIAIVAANFEQRLAARCAPTHPMPVILIHGSADPLVPEAGGDLEGATLLSTPATVARWAALAGCKPAPAAPLPTLVNDGTSVTRATYAGCRGGGQVIYYDILGGGHAWPGGLQYLPASIIGKTSRNLDASQTIWRFCDQYHL